MQLFNLSRIIKATILFTGITLCLTATAATPAVFEAEDCYTSGLNDKKDYTVSSFTLANNTFEDYGQPYLFSAVRITKQDYTYSSLLGAALITVSKNGTNIDGLFVCNKANDNQRKTHFSQPDFTFENSLSLSEIITAGKKTYDLEGGVYMGDEHVATKGSTLVAEVVAQDSGAYTVKFTLTLNVSDLTLGTDEDDDENLATHEVLQADFFMTLPAMSLK